MSNRFFQGVVYQLRESIDRTVGVLDDSGTVIACSDLIKIGEKHDGVLSSVNSTLDTVKEDGYTYKPLSPRPALSILRLLRARTSFRTSLFLLLL